MSSLAKQLAPMRGPKQIVLLSSGFPFGQDLLPLYNQFTAAAAEAQIVFYAIHLEGAGADVTHEQAGGHLRIRRTPNSPAAWAMSPR